MIESFDIWSARKNSDDILESELPDYNRLLSTGFEYLDETVRKLDQLAKKRENSFHAMYARVVASCVTKGRRLLLGMYALVCNGLAQESGAVLRIIIEVIELVQYFNDDPSRIDEALDGTLPSPGVIAQKINGSHRELRKYLSENASHFSFTPDSTQQFVDIDTEIHLTKPGTSKKNLQFNLSLLNAMQVLLLKEVLQCLLSLDQSNASCADTVELWRLECIESVSPPLKDGPS